MAFDFDQPQPLAEAVQAVSKKTPVGAALDSRQWQEEVPAILREQAIFSAKVESVKAMQEVKDRLTKLLTMARDEKAKVASAANAGQPGAYQMDRGKFIAETQKMANRLGLRTKDAAKKGSVQDFGSERRLKLIYEQQVGAAQGRAFYLQGQDPDVLDGWPAQELVRVAARKKERDWTRRWSEAAAKVGYQGVSRAAMREGRMIALKTSPIWVAISRFERPYPPFDFGSGMGIEEIDREAAEALGDLVQPGERIEPSVEETQRKLEASAAGLDPDMRAALKKTFGDQLVVEGDRVRWTPATKLPPDAQFDSMPQTTPAPEPPHEPDPPVPDPPPRRAPASAKIAVDPSVPHPLPVARVKALSDVAHDDGELRTIRVVGQIDDGGSSYDGRTREVRLAPGGDLPHYEAAHELAHAYDHGGAHNPVYRASEHSRELTAWREAVASSAKIRELGEAMQTAPGNERLAYAARWRELWARSYVQWLAKTTGDPALLRELDRLRNSPDPATRLLQWTDEDFEPIGKAIEAAFVTRGWLP